MYKFFLYPFTHVSLNKGVFLYNTLNNQFFEKYDVEIIDLVNRLFDNEIRVTTLDRFPLDSEVLNDFLYKVRNTFMGDFIETSSNSTLPVQLIDDLKIHKNNEKGEAEGSGIEIMDYLTRCLIYINGYCDKNCVGCGKIYKQLTFCKKKDKMFIDFDLLKENLSMLSGLGICDICLTGGNIFFYPYISQLLDFIKDKQISVTFIVNQKQLKGQIGKGLLNKMMGKKVKLLVNDLDYFLLHKDLLMSWVREMEFSCLFLVDSVEEFDRLEEVSKDLGEVPLDFKAFYDGENISFFEEMVYITKEDLFDEKHSLNSILTNQVINRNFFGNIIIDCDLHVYSSFCRNSLGRIIEFSIQELIYKEINSDLAWKLTRNKLPVCRSCNYQYLCPPLGNYEMVLDKPNLCHIAD